MRKGKKKIQLYCYGHANLSLPSHLALSSLLSPSQFLHLSMLGLPHIQIQVVTTLSLLFLFCQKYMPQNHSPGSRTTIELFQTYSYKFYFYSLNFQIDCPSSSSISYMDIDLKCWSITQRMCD